MNSLWNTQFGKVIVGGCGTQIGLLVTCGTLSALLLVCAICGFANVVTVGVAQDVAILPEPTGPITPTATVTPTPTSAALESLLGEVRLLHGEVEFLRSNMAAPSVPTSTPSPSPTPIPFLTANQSGVNMRSGPSTTYNRVGVLPLGENIEIVGRNEASTWWLVATQDGMFAWVSADLVTANHATEAIPVVTIPSLLVWGTPTVPVPTQAAISSDPALIEPILPGSEGRLEPRPLVPIGTPTASAVATRQFVQDMPAYQRLRGHLLVPPVSESVSPHGDEIAMTERIKLYTVTTDGALTQIWMEENTEIGPLGNIVWSPDGDYLALDIGYKDQYCKPCAGVAVLRLADGKTTFLEHPDELDLSAPRWTQNGLLLVTAHPGEPADGITYIYSISGQGQPASGAYVLSSSHEGQRWFPWLPGKTWLVGSFERPDSYNAD